MSVQLHTGWERRSYDVALDLPPELREKLRVWDESTRGTYPWLRAAPLFGRPKLYRSEDFK